MGWLDRFKPKGSLADKLAGGWNSLFGSDAPRKLEEEARKTNALEERTRLERQRFLNEGLDDCLKPRDAEASYGSLDVPLDVIHTVVYGAEKRVDDYNRSLRVEDLGRSPNIQMREFTFSEFSDALVKRKVNRDRADIVRETLDNFFEYTRDKHIQYGSFSQETMDRIIGKTNAKVEAYNNTSKMKMSPITDDEMRADLTQHKGYWQRANEYVVNFERQIVEYYREFIINHANGKDRSTKEYAGLLEQWEEELWVNVNTAFDNLQKTEGIYIEKLADVKQMRDIAFTRGRIKDIMYLPIKSGQFLRDYVIPTDELQTLVQLSSRASHN